MTNTTLSRFQIIDGTPPCAPGKCVICGTTAGPFIDFGLELDFYGVVYICFINCLRELALGFEYYPPEYVNELQKDRQNLVTQNADLTAYNKELSDVIDSFSKLRNNPPDSLPGQLAFDFSESEESEVPAGTTGTHSEVIPERTGKSRTRKAGSTKQNDEQGSSGVHSDVSVDPILSDTI